MLPVCEGTLPVPPIRPPAFFHPLSRARPRGRASMQPASRVPLTPFAPHCRCATWRSRTSTGSTTRSAAWIATSISVPQPSTGRVYRVAALHRVRCEIIRNEIAVSLRHGNRLPKWSSTRESSGAHVYTRAWLMREYLTVPIERRHWSSSVHRAVCWLF